MLQRSQISKQLWVGLLGLGLVSTLAACNAPDSTAESPSTTESSTAETNQPLTTGAQSPIAEAETPVTGETEAAAGSGETLDQVVANNSSFSKLEAAIQAAGLESVLSQPGPYTVFAPTDEAFDKLPPDIAEQLMRPENQEKLKQVLAYHLVPGDITSASIVPGEVATVEGQPVTIAKTDEQVTVDNARVTQPDLTASNGVVHAVDEVLIPPGLDLN